MPWIFVSKRFFEENVALGLTIWRGFGKPSLKKHHQRKFLSGVRYFSAKVAEVSGWFFSDFFGCNVGIVKFRNTYMSLHTKSLVLFGENAQ